MEIDVFCVAPDEELFSHIRENCAFTQRWAKNVSAHEGAAVIVGGGPSLRSRIDGIRKRQALGQTIFALNGAARFLNESGVVPDYQVMLDPQAFVKDLIAPAKTYLVASQCHPDVLKAVPNAILWHLAVEGAQEQLPEHADDYCLVGGGVTVGLSSLCLVYSMGFRKLHLYGFDSSFENQGHAYGSPMSAASHGVRVMLGSRRFVSTLTLIRQAQDFPRVCDDLIDRGCLITVDCDGLLRAIVDENHIAARAA